MNYRALTAVALAILIGGGLYFYESPASPPPPEKVNKPKENRGVGIIDMEKIQAAHPDGELLNRLQETELRLRLELNEAMKIIQIPKPVAPVPDEKIFDEAAWQKNAQLIISQRAELEIKKKAAAEEYRKNSEPQYIAQRDKIRQQFMNENFNIRLKLKNADNLRLSQEKIDELLMRLEELELQRNDLQKELLEKWLAEIEQYAKEAVADDELKLRAEAERLGQEVEERERQKEAEVAQRNKKIMEDAVQKMEDRQIRRRELSARLQEVTAQRVELEKKILQSIADKAIMLAAANHLELLLVKSNPSISDKVLPSGIEWNFESGKTEQIGAAVFAGKDSRDLTDELIKEMNRL